MALDIIETGRTLIYDGLAQNDVDMANHRLINLDTSNLPPIGIPPSVTPPTNQWLHSWDAPGQIWTATQPRFSDIAEFLTGPQMQHIDQLGRVRIGEWQASMIGAQFLPTLDLIRAPAGNVSLAGHRLTGVSSPVDQGDAVNKGFMDFLLQGLNPKEAVRVASPGSGRPWPGPGGLGEIDGIDIVDGDRVLLYHFTSGREFNEGIWIAHEVSWERAPDTLGPGGLDRAYCTVLEGEFNAGKSFVQSVALAHNPPTLGDDPNWLLFSSGGSGSGSSIIAGAGLTRDVNTLNVGGTTNRISVGADSINISASYVGQTSITTLGTITSGTWHGGIIGSDFGGTGVNNQGFGIHLDGEFSVLNADTGPDATEAGLVLQVAGFCVATMPSGGGTLATLANPETLSNKRIIKRRATIASNSKPSINVDNVDVFHITSLSEDILSMTDNLTGTPTDGQELFIWITQQSLGDEVEVVFNIAWGSAWVASPALSLPVLTVASGRIFLWFVYNSVVSKWVLTQKVENVP